MLQPSIRFGALTFIPVARSKKEAGEKPGSIVREDLEALAMQVSNEANADVKIVYHNRIGDKVWHRQDQATSPVAGEPLTTTIATINAQTHDSDDVDGMSMLDIELPDPEAMFQTYLTQRGVRVTHVNNFANV